MGRKVFISYKYADEDVKELSSVSAWERTKVRDYVDVIQAKLDSGIHVNKGEADNESLDEFKDDTIRSKLADKIFDSSVTIVLISPNMKERWQSESNQWIPWEIAYSIKNKQRATNQSKRNAILLVVLPDSNGNYSYADGDDFHFEIIQKNLDNLKYPYPAKYLKPSCSQSYFLMCNWNQFLSNINGYINASVEIKENADKYNIRVNV